MAFVKRAELHNVVQKLGGPSVVGRAIDPPITSQAVSHWKVLPVEHVPVLVAMCREKGVRRSNGEPYRACDFRDDVPWSLLESSVAQPE